MSQKQTVDQLPIEITWSVMQDMVRKLADAIATTYPAPFNIWGLPRAGTIVANLLSHYWDKQDCNIFNGHTPPTLYVGDGECPLLIIDEIADTGETFKLCKNHADCTLQSTKFISLFKRYSCSFPTDLTLEIVMDERYVVMPWEVNGAETPKRIIANQVLNYQIQQQAAIKDAAKLYEGSDEQLVNGQLSKEVAGYFSDENLYIYQTGNYREVVRMLKSVIDTDIPDWKARIERYEEEQRILCQ